MKAECDKATTERDKALRDPSDLSQSTTPRASMSSTPRPDLSQSSTPRPNPPHQDLSQVSTPRPNPPCPDLSQSSTPRPDPSKSSSWQSSSVLQHNAKDQDGLRTAKVGIYTYTITPQDLKIEQEAFVAGEGVRN